MNKRIQKNLENKYSNPVIKMDLISEAIVEENDINDEELHNIQRNFDEFKEVKSPHSKKSFGFNDHEYYDPGLRGSKNKLRNSNTSLKWRRQRITGQMV